MLLSSFKKNILGISIFFALFTANASATIVSKGDYVQDDKSGLDWLSVTKTKGKSYNEILRMIAAGGSLEGWRLAARDEFAAIVFNWFGYTPSYFNSNSNSSKFKGLIDLLGKTRANFMRGYVLHNTTNGMITVGHLSANYDGSGTYVKNSEWKYANTRYYDIGALLVRTSAVSTVSEPASLGLIGLGLIGIAAFSRRRRLS